MLTTTQLTQQLALQARLNAVVNPDWIAAGYAWPRAAMIEGVEAMEHWGWKWWKKQVANLPQVQIELVDIWHFTLSAFLAHSKGDIHDAAGNIRFDMRNSYCSGGTFNDSMQRFIGEAARGNFDLGAFGSCCIAAGLSWDHLHNLYVAKNVLNIFRQANGYKEGTYVKEWHGQEDNVYLETLLINEPGLDPEEILTKLGETYARILKEVK